MSAKTSAEQAASSYESSEEAFLVGIREGRDRAIKTKLAEAVAMRASAWNSAEYAALHAALKDAERAEHDYTTERTEVLMYLWDDIARAYRGEAAHHDG